MSDILSKRRRRSTWLKKWRSGEEKTGKLERKRKRKEAAKKATASHMRRRRSDEHDDVIYPSYEQQQAPEDSKNVTHVKAVLPNLSQCDKCGYQTDTLIRTVKSLKDKRCNTERKGVDTSSRRLKELEAENQRLRHVLALQLSKVENQ